MLSFLFKVFLFFIVLIDFSYANNENNINLAENIEKSNQIEIKDNSLKENEEANKKSPIIEGIVGAGFMGFEPMFFDKSAMSSSDHYFPYGKIHLRFDNGKFLRPEFLIEESGQFKFDIKGIKTGSHQTSYNKYYLKIPTGLKIPFFSYKSQFYVDGLYSSSSMVLRLKKKMTVNNVMRNAGERFTANLSEMTFRIYLDTPIVLEPSIFEYSYFGVFYSQRVVPRMAKPPAHLISISSDILLSTEIKTGGIFYEMKKDTPLKGLNFDIYAAIGYGDLFGLDDVNSVYSASFGNTKGLVTIFAKAGLGYRYVFKTGLGIDINVGASYFITSEFINSPNPDKFTMNMGGDLRYFANLSFVFAY